MTCPGQLSTPAQVGSHRQHWQDMIDARSHLPRIKRSYTCRVLSGALGRATLCNISLCLSFSLSLVQSDQKKSNYCSIPDYAAHCFWLTKHIFCSAAIPYLISPYWTFDVARVPSQGKFHRLSYQQRYSWNSTFQVEHRRLQSNSSVLTAFLLTQGASSG